MGLGRGTLDHGVLLPHALIPGNRATPATVVAHVTVVAPALRRTACGIVHAHGGTVKAAPWRRGGLELTIRLPRSDPRDLLRGPPACEFEPAVTPRQGGGT